MYDEARRNKNLRVVLMLPLMAVLVDVVIMSMVGAHHPQDLIAGPVVLGALAPVVIYLLRRVPEAPVLPKGIRVIRPTRHG